MEASVSSELRSSLLLRSPQRAFFARLDGVVAWDDSTWIGRPRTVQRIVVWRCAYAVMREVTRGGFWNMIWRDSTKAIHRDTHFSPLASLQKACQPFRYCHDSRAYL